MVKLGLYLLAFAQILVDFTGITTPGLPVAKLNLKASPILVLKLS